MIGGGQGKSSEFGLSSSLSSLRCGGGDPGGLGANRLVGEACWTVTRGIL